MTGNKKNSSKFVAAQQGFHLLVHVLQIVVLSRLLEPEDYGLAAMAGVVFTMANVFKDFGFSSSAIQSKEISKQDSDNLFWIGIFVSIGIAALIAASSPFVAMFYKQSMVTWLILVMAVTYLIAALGNQPKALAQREFRFRELAIWAIAGKSLGFSSGIWAAMSGWGPWSIVVMHLVEGVITSLGSFVVSGYVPGKMKNLQETRDHFKFGTLLTVSGLMSFFSRNTDKILIGRFFGAASLGFYTRAHGLLIFPMTSILSGFNRLNLASLSRLADKPAKFHRTQVQILQFYLLASAAIILPATVAARDVVLLAMGEKWLPVVPVFVITSPYAWYKIVSYICNVSMISKGKMAALTKLHFWNCILSVVTILAATPFGLHGLAMAFSISGVVIQQPLFLIVAQRNDAIDWKKIVSLLVQYAILFAAVVGICQAVNKMALQELISIYRIVIVVLTANLLLFSGVCAIPEGRKFILSKLRFSKREVAGTEGAR